MTSIFKRRDIAIALIAGLLLSGCATMSPSRHATAVNGPAAEREALKVAAAAINQTSWPKPEKISIGALLTGFIGSDGDRDRVSKDDAVDVYVASLSEQAMSFPTLLADADHHLIAARSLTAAAVAASYSIRPTVGDIAIVENAISDMRENRDIYIAALKALEKDGVLVGDHSGDTLKSSFNDAIKSIGEAADRLAARIDDDRTETYAAATNQQGRR